MAKQRLENREFTETELDRMFENASRLGEEEFMQGPRARRASYDRNRRALVLEMMGGSLIVRPVAQIQGLSNVRPEDISLVALTEDGDTLQWDNLDLDLSVAGLVSGVLGSSAWMAELGRKGGSVTTDAKASAARINGRKGGRPPLMRAAAAAAASNSLIVQAMAVHPDIDHLDIAVRGGSHQSLHDLARYETGLIAAQSPLGRTISIPSAGVLSDKPDFLVHAVASRSGEKLEEADNNAELALAA